MVTKAELQFYRERWKAVEEIEREELRASTPESNWRHFNAILQRANQMGLPKRGEDGEMEVFLRWAKLKGEE